MNSERKYPPHEVVARLEAFCAYQERCTFELIRKLNDWGYTSEESNDLIAELKRKGFVDDERFAESFVAGKFRFKKWGRIKLRHELRARKIHDEVIKIAIGNIDPDTYYSVLNELASRKWKEVRGKDNWEKKGKLIRFLASKGYEMDLISDVVAQF